MLRYQVGAPPLFRRVAVRRPPALGGDLVVLRAGDVPRRLLPEPAPQTARYWVAGSAEWNGRQLPLADGPAYVAYEELLRGGTLVFRA